MPISFVNAYDWVNRFVTAGSPTIHLSFSANRLNGQLVAMAGYPNAVILGLIDRMLFLSTGSTDTLERAEIHLACARSYFMIGEYYDALNQLDAAGKFYLSDPHNQALVFWMEGRVYLVLGMRDDAIQCWQRSLEGFEMLAKHTRTGRKGANWYLERCAEMRTDISTWI